MGKKLEIAAIVAAATIGEGVFALPYVIDHSGWLISIAWFVAIAAVVTVAHIIYLRTLAEVREKSRLLGLARKYFGETGFWIGFAAIVIGLLLGFVAYLVLGSHFLGILLPGISPLAALLLFWFMLACLIWGSEGKIAGLEVAGIALITVAIFFIFFTGRPALALANMAPVVPGNFFLPFGAVLFALAGWTSVEQIYEIIRKKKSATVVTPGMFWVFLAGTSFAGVLYWLFALGVIGSVPYVAADTVSGIALWPAWKQSALAVIGIAALCVVSLPIARELRGAIEKDLKWNQFASRAAIILIPLATVLAGLTNFLTIVSIAGGIFLVVQYLLIISVGRRALALVPREKALLDVLAILFICAAIYQIAIFVVH
jgi:amino acid permease